MENQTPIKLTVWQNPTTGEIRIIDKAEVAMDAVEITATAYRPDAKSPPKAMPVFERVTDAAFRPKGLREEDIGSVGLRGLDEVVLAGKRLRVYRAGHETMADPVTGEQLLRLDLVEM